MSGPPYQYLVLHQSLKDHPGMIAVHAAHAAGESCLNGPAMPDTHLVVLEATSSAGLEEAAGRLGHEGILY